MLKLIECPRDAMQGIKTFIPTETKIRYAQKLLDVGFDSLDVGSFVSPKAIPQMRDTSELISGLDLSETSTKLLTIIANKRGAHDAVKHEKITYLGFPFSISETFQLRNTNATIEESLQRVADIQSISIKNKKQLVVYISMGFGNPYGDEWSVDIVKKWVSDLYAMGIRIINLSDTIGVSHQKVSVICFLTLSPHSEMSTLERTCIRHQTNGRRKYMLLMKTAVDGLMELSKVMEAALWPKMILQATCLQKRCLIILMNAIFQPVYREKALITHLSGVVKYLLINHSLPIVLNKTLS